MITSDLYGYPVLMNAGLGNMLVPWAKCVIWCNDNGAKMIAPFWTKPRIGPFLRFERDKRQYQRLFTHGGEISGVRRLILLARSRSVEVSELPNGSEMADAGPVVVRFRNMDNAEVLAGRHEEVAAALYRITKPKYRPPENSSEPFIAVHVRLGDFTRASEAELKSGTHCRRIPVEWYADAVVALRASLGIDMPAKIFCDGSDAELAPLLRLNGVKRAEPASAVTDMLALAQARVLVASGSAFSMWGCYLGGIPAVWFPGQQFSLRGRGPENALDVEWERGGSFNSAFLSAARAEKRRAGPAHPPLVAEAR